MSEQAVETDESASSEEDLFDLDVTEEVEEVEEVQPEAEKADDFIPAEQLSERAQKRIDKLTAEKYEERRRAEELQSRLDAIQAEKDAAVLNQPEPVEDNFSTDDEYVKALREHYTRQGEARGRQAAVEESRQQARIAEYSQIEQSFNQKVAEFVAKVPDYAETVAPLAGLNADVQLAIKKLDNAPEVAFYLGKNLDVANELHFADPVTAGQIIADTRRIIAESAKQKTISQAGGVNAGLATAGSPVTEKEDPLIAGAKFE